MKPNDPDLKILKVAPSTVYGKYVSLTVKSDSMGKIRHGVVLTNTYTGRHHKVATFTNIGDAFKLFKALERRVSQ